MKKEQAKNGENLNCCGAVDAPVLVVCDAPHKSVWEEGGVMGQRAMAMFLDRAEEVGMDREDFAFITACPPMPDEASGSASREGKFVDSFQDEYRSLLGQFTKQRLTLFLGAVAGRQAMGRPVKITKIRGQVHTEEGRIPMMGIFSPYMVLKRPEVREVWDMDICALWKLKEAGWDMDAFRESKEKVVYEWRTDISDLVEKPPKALALDTEFTGAKVVEEDDEDEDEEGGPKQKVLRWYDRNVRVLVCTITTAAGTGYCIPLDTAYYPKLSRRGRMTLIAQLRELLGNPDVAVTGHNLNADNHVLKKIGVTVADYRHDSMQLAFVVDDNMTQKSLSECTRRWIPALSGYSDDFDNKTDKSRMDLVPHEDMLAYAVGDTDATFRLTNKLVTLGREDARNWHVYRSVQMPALRMFFDMEETGLRIDTAKLGELGTMVREQRQELHNRLMREVPRAVRLKHADKGLSFSRANFVRDILFSEEGFALTPKVFTKSTRKLPEDQRIPSISSKEHLPFFDDDPWVRDFIQHQKMAKMESTYVGTPGGELIPQRSKTAPPKYTAPSGFWKYLSDEGKIHPSYFLHRTVTGRVASAYPNGQNFPKRGKLAKAFRKIFVPEPGWCFIQADLSQAEVRIVAWMSGDPTMLKIYREGGDIHSYTAASILGVGYTDFQSWKGSEEPLSARYRNMLPNDIAADCTTFGKFFDYKRFQAKAVVFGFLYGMGWKKFMSYAKTDYGITFNEQEARDIRATFFRTYSRVEPWHKSMTQFVNEHGYVRALHGSLRRLPNIFSPDDNTRSMTERMAINSPVQRFASDVGLMGMTRFFRDADPDIVRPSAFIHDAAAIMTRIEHKDEMASALKWYMQTPPLELWYGLKPPLPIVSDVEWSAESMGDLEEMKGLEAVRPSWFRPDLDEAFAK